MDKVVRAHVIASGKVQGVFFRADARQKAVSLGLDGWVRNVPDGTVEAVFEGERGRVERAIEWCRHGPKWARVSEVKITWEDPIAEDGFRVIV